jgi:hypothetical protein
MNPTDYILLAVLAGGGFYISYRLFLGYRATRSSGPEQVRAAAAAAYAEASRTENTMADIDR